MRILLRLLSILIVISIAGSPVCFADDSATLGTKDSGSLGTRDSGSFGTNTPGSLGARNFGPLRTRNYSHGGTLSPSIPMAKFRRQPQANRSPFDTDPFFKSSSIGGCLPSGSSINSSSMITNAGLAKNGRLVTRSKPQGAVAGALPNRNSPGGNGFFNADGNRALKNGSVVSKNNVDGSTSVKTKQGYALTSKSDGSKVFSRTNGIDTVFKPGQAPVMQTKDGHVVQEIK